jgi:hypothetical protein
VETVEFSNSSLSHGQQRKWKMAACSYFYDLLRVCRNCFSPGCAVSKTSRQAMSATSDIGIGNIPVSAVLHGYNGCDVIGLHLNHQKMPCHVMSCRRYEACACGRSQICRRHLPATVWESLWQMAGVTPNARKNITYDGGLEISMCI